ncbi:hypothetical protein ES319_A03G100900v1 [Gossypium barbadense]|uniref:Uncharacterized protein n=2 Tax=Gossypium TaxID=3633 RepID=A0A5J5WBH6_GOSBA|nr:hypothetical protein ES319_A03G100900v1 [Gossypium barbadense]
MWYSPLYHAMRDAWDMAAEICLSQLPSLVEDCNAKFQVWSRSIKKLCWN